MNQTRISKFLSLLLRHQPEKIGLTLDNHGWADVDELLEKMALHGKKIDRETLIQVVNNCQKNRFSFDATKQKIRANQGHSIQIDLNLMAQIPPETLYHGTASRFVASILKQGLTKQNRHHVHLSQDIQTAQAVGRRHGKPVIFAINTVAMLADNHAFYVSKNDVWLCDAVPAKYLQKIN